MLRIKKRMTISISSKALKKIAKVSRTIIDKDKLRSLGQHSRNFSKTLSYRVFTWSGEFSIGIYWSLCCTVADSSLTSIFHNIRENLNIPPP